MGSPGDTSCTLADLPTGARARIASLSAHGALRRRLLDLGFVPGTEVEAAVRAPSGSPVAFRLRGVTLALRLTDARLVHTTRPAAPEGMSPP